MKVISQNLIELDCFQKQDGELTRQTVQVNPKKILFTSFHKENDSKTEKPIFRHELDFFKVVIGSYGATQNFIIDGREFIFLSVYRAAGKEAIDVMHEKTSKEELEDEFVYEEVFYRIKDPIGHLDAVMAVVEKYYKFWYGRTLPYGKL